jgi:membrane-bound ClpP family serine protease
MWVIAGVLLGLVLTGSLLGFHTGPHSHAAAAVLGVVTAAWLALMLVDGRSATILYALLGTDVVLSGAVGTLAVRGLSGQRHLSSRGTRGLVGAEGVALSVLDPDGMVRVNGEDWSARSLNGRVTKGASIQVMKAGVRLEVWGEDTPPAALGSLTVTRDDEPDDARTGEVEGEVRMDDERRAESL